MCHYIEILPIFSAFLPFCGHLATAVGLNSTCFSEVGLGFFCGYSAGKLVELYSPIRNICRSTFSKLYRFPDVHHFSLKKLQAAVTKIRIKNRNIRIHSCFQGPGSFDT